MNGCCVAGCKSELYENQKLGAVLEMKIIFKIQTVYFCTPLLKLILDGNSEVQYLQVTRCMFIISTELMNASHFFTKFCIDKRTK